MTGFVVSVSSSSQAQWTVRKCSWHEPIRFERNHLCEANEDEAARTVVDWKWWTSMVSACWAMFPRFWARIVIIDPSYQTRIHHRPVVLRRTMRKIISRMAKNGYDRHELESFARRASFSHSTVTFQVNDKRNRNAINGRGSAKTDRISCW